MSLFNTQPTLWRGRSGKENAQLCWCFLSLTVLLFRRKLTGMCAHDSLFAAAWIVAHQAPLSTDFSRQQNWSVLSFPTPGDLPNSEIKPRSLVPPDCRWILYHGATCEVLLTGIWMPNGMWEISSVQFSRSVMSDSLQPHGLQHDRLPFHHQLPVLTQSHVHWISDAIQSSHPLSSPSPPAFNLSQHQGLFKWVSSSNQVVIVLEFQL